MSGRLEPVSGPVAAFAAKVQQCWSRETATTYMPDNPALGQCSVTALVAQDHLGGTLLKTRVGDAWHFYNLISDQRHDFTASQFAEPIGYDDLPSSREEALRDTSLAQYECLAEAVTGMSKPERYE